MLRTDDEEDEVQSLMADIHSVIAEDDQSGVTQQTETTFMRSSASMPHVYSQHPSMPALVSQSSYHHVGSGSMDPDSSVTPVAMLSDTRDTGRKFIDAMRANHYLHVESERQRKFPIAMYSKNMYRHTLFWVVMQMASVFWMLLHTGDAVTKVSVLVLFLGFLTFLFFALLSTYKKTYPVNLILMQLILAICAFSTGYVASTFGTS